MYSSESDEILTTRDDPTQIDSADQAVKSDEFSNLREAFSRIPPDQQKVLELSYFKGMNHVEISEHLELSLGTVKSRIRLGVEKLRHHLSTLRA